MGDGRYYSYDQFVSIVILTLLTVFSIMSSVITYYRSQNTYGRKYVLFAFFGICLIAVLRVVESLVPSLSTGNILRYLTSMLVILVYVNLNLYLFVYIFPVYRINSVKGKKNLKVDITLGMLSFFIVLSGFISKGRLLIAVYRFQKVEYSVIYLISLVLLFLFLVVTTIKIASLRFRFHKAYENKTISLILILFIGIPMGIYIFAIASHYDFINFVEFFLYCALCVATNIVISYSPFYGINITLFEKIGDMIFDSIFVIDNNNNIIYKNKAADNKLFFQAEENLQFNDFTHVFQSDVKTSYFGKQHFQVIIRDEIHYFTHRKKALKNEDEIIGFIITITDITELMELVYDLKDRKESAEEANMKLKNYSKIVYQLEKEKAINALLEDIILSREKEMANLVSEINGLKMKLGNEQFEYDMDQLIDYNAKILLDVREAVTTYKEHYGG